MHEFQLFLASPSDVIKEREIVAETIETINKITERFSDFKIRLNRWEERTFPQMGSDPQSIINLQISNEQEFYIIIFWHRFGTPTPRAGSGTEEEFNRAYDSLMARKGSLNEPIVMLYFKTSDLPYNVDLDQVSKVRAFRDKIKSDGLIFEFKDSDEFKSKFFDNLIDAIATYATKMQKFTESTQNGSLNVDLSRTTSPSSSDEPSGDESRSDTEIADTSLTDEEPGLLELKSAFETSMQTAADDLKKLNNTMSKYNKKINFDKQKLFTRNNQLNRSKFENYLNEMADATILMSADLNDHLRVQKDSFLPAIYSYKNILSIRKKFQIQHDNIHEEVEMFKGLINSMDEMLTGFSNLKSTLENLPPISIKFNQAKNKYQIALSAFTEFIGTIKTEIEDILISL